MFHFCTCLREMIEILSDLAKTNIVFFGRHCLREVFQTLHDYNLAGGLAIHTRFDGLDLISRSQVCQNY